MPRSLGLVTVLVLSFVVFIFGQVLAGTPLDNKKNVAPSEGLAKAFKAADRLAALDKGASKPGITSSKKAKSTSKYSGKKNATKKSSYSKLKNSKKTASLKNKYSKKSVTSKKRSHKNDRKQKTAKRFS